MECEFALAFQPQGNPGPHPQDPRQIYGIVKTQSADGEVNGDQVDSKAKLSSLLLTPPQREDLARERERKMEVEGHIVATLGNFKIAASSEALLKDLRKDPQIEDWVVACDRTVRAKHPSYEFMPMEIKTPPFYYHRNSVQQVSSVCQILTNSYRAVCTDTTGL